MHFKIWSDDDGDRLETRVNQFLDEHPSIVIADYKMTTSLYQNDYGRGIVGTAQYQVGLFYRDQLNDKK